MLTLIIGIVIGALTPDEVKKGVVSRLKHLFK